jgi:hypothetical protein
MLKIGLFSAILVDLRRAVGGFQPADMVEKGQLTS